MIKNDTCIMGSGGPSNVWSLTHTKDLMSGCISLSHISFDYFLNLSLVRLSNFMEVK